MQIGALRCRNALVERRRRQGLAKVDDRDVELAAASNALATSAMIVYRLPIRSDGAEVAQVFVLARYATL